MAKSAPRIDILITQHCHSIPGASTNFAQPFPSTLRFRPFR